MDHTISQHFKIPALQNRLAEAKQRAIELQGPALISITVPIRYPCDPMRMYSAAGRVSCIRSFWARPTDGFWVVGVGQTTEIRVTGINRFQHAISKHRSLMKTAVIHTTSDNDPGPLFMGGFRFDANEYTNGLWKEFPDGLMTLPRWTVSMKDGDCWVTINLMIEESTDIQQLSHTIEMEGNWIYQAPIQKPEFKGAIVSDELDSSQWEIKIQKALTKIEDGHLTKVTLARTTQVQLATPIIPEIILERLFNEYAGCRVFAIAKKDSCFVGATPDELVSSNNTQVHSSCLAGSAQRGDSDIEDRILSTQLARSPKELWEHAIVVNWISEYLSKLCQDLQWNKEPRIVKLRNVQHLGTAFTGILAGDHHILELVAALHPTPAVGGIPLESAWETIRELEQFDRGWYAGPIGWMDAQGQGEFGIALRSALIHGNAAHLYAGAGIVAGSDPEKEYQETAMKFNALLSAFGIR